MDIRKIAVVGSFAAGVALALAPLASAVPVDPLLPFVDSEISSMNSLFVGEAGLAGVGADVVTHGPDTFDTIPLIDAPNSGTPTTLDYELYGLNPIANAASDPGAFSEFNGALVNFDDAYNVELFSLLNPTAAIDTIPAGDLFGSASGIAEALATGSATNVVTDFLTDGFADLQRVLHAVIRFALHIEPPEDHSGGFVWPAVPAIVLQRPSADTSPTSTTASPRWPTVCCSSPASSTSGRCAPSTWTGWTSSASAASPSRRRTCGCRGTLTAPTTSCQGGTTWPRCPGSN